MAVSLGFGILFTTFVCLLFLPSLYLLLNNALDRIAGWRSGIAQA
jgi:hypothetical protein